MKQDIGTGSKPPENICEEKNCPWHGTLKIRGRTFKGTVKSAKAHNTAIVEWSFRKKVPKYERYERRHSKVSVFNPPCIHAREGELVLIAECKPISKTKNFVLVEVLGKGEVNIKGEDLKEKKPKKSKEEVNESDK